jgi:hypothetical protein
MQLDGHVVTLFSLREVLWAWKWRQWHSLGSAMLHAVTIFQQPWALGCSTWELYSEGCVHVRDKKTFIFGRSANTEWSGICNKLLSSDIWFRCLINSALNTMTRPSFKVIPFVQLDKGAHIWAGFVQNCVQFVWTRCTTVYKAGNYSNTKRQRTVCNVLFSGPVHPDLPDTTSFWDGSLPPLRGSSSSK